MPLLFAPDVDPSAPGIITTGFGLRPTEYGYANYRAYGNAGWTALAGTPLAMYAHNYMGNGRIIVHDTNQRLWSFWSVAGGYDKTDVSAGGTPYATPLYAGNSGYISTEEDPQTFAFTSFGTYCIAGRKWDAELQQQSGVVGPFTAISGSPAAATLCTFKNFVIAGNVGNYGAVTGSNDMLAWSALGNHTDWVPSPTTQAGYQQLLDIPGRIICVKPLGDAVAVYKANGIWLMRYIGPPNIWSYTLVANNIGMHASWDKPPPIVDIGRAHLFVSRDDICIFDGTRVQSATKGVLREWLRSTFWGNGTGRLASTSMTHDMRKAEVQFNDFVVDASQGGGIVYNYKLGKWGMAPAENRMVAACESSVSMLGGPSSGELSEPGMFCGYIDGKLYTRYNGNSDYAPMAVSVTMGNNGHMSTLQRVVPKWKNPPNGTCSMTYATMPYLGGTETAGTAGTWDSTNKRFDLVRAAYWHKLNMTFAQSPYPNSYKVELLDLEYVFTGSGKKVEGALGPGPR